MNATQFGTFKPFQPRVNLAAALLTAAKVFSPTLDHPTNQYVCDIMQSLINQQLILHSSAFLWQTHSLASGSAAAATTANSCLVFSSSMTESLPVLRSREEQRQ